MCFFLLQKKVAEYLLLNEDQMPYKLSFSVNQSYGSFTHDPLQYCCHNRSRPELLSDKDCTGLDNDYSHVMGTGSQSDQHTTILDDMDNIQHTLSQNTSVGVGSSDDEIELFEDDDSW